MLNLLETINSVISKTLSFGTGLLNIWGKSFWTILGVADFKTEITVICGPHLTQNDKRKTLVSLRELSNSSPLLPPHVLETKEHKTEESCCLSYSLVNLIILMRSSDSFLELLIAVRIFIFFPPLKRALTSHETLLKQPDIIRLRLSASLLPGRRNAALGGWLSTTAYRK